MCDGVAVNALTEVRVDNDLLDGHAVKNVADNGVRHNAGVADFRKHAGVQLDVRAESRPAFDIVHGRADEEVRVIDDHLFKLHLRSLVQQLVYLCNAAVAGGEDKIRVSLDELKYLYDFGQKLAVFVQIIHGLFGHAHIAGAGEMSLVFVDMALGGNGGHIDKLCAHAVCRVKRVEIEETNGVIQRDAAEYTNAGGIVEVFLHDLRAHGGGEIVILDDERAIACALGKEHHLRAVYKAVRNRGTGVDMHVYNAVQKTFSH